MFFDDRFAMPPIENPFQSSSFGGRLQGDFYSLDDDVLRGIALAPSELPGDFYDDELVKGFGPAPTEDSKFSGISNASARFENSQIPPDMPADPHFKLATSTFISRC